ncbi:MAG: cold shock domain-containing protein [Bacteroidales bacterium]|nr:cold shock domain-containing protein [Bacteroidales bacterium]
MGRSQETFNKKEVRNKKEKKRKDKEQKRQARKENDKKSSFDDMIAYVDEYGQITSTPPDPDKKSKIKAEDIELGVPKRDTEDGANTVRKGIVSFFNHDKGFGFIRDISTQESIFVHINNTEEPIKEDNKVSFEVEKGPKGLTALKVKLIK